MSGEFFSDLGRSFNALFLKSNEAQTSPGCIIKDTKYCKTNKFSFLKEGLPS